MPEPKPDPRPDSEPDPRPASNAGGGRPGRAGGEPGGGSRPDSERRPRRDAWPAIEGFEIEGLIGRGSTGVVYRARQIAVDRAVALKVLLPELAGKPRTVQRLQREARTMARLAHPHLVSAIDMGSEEGLWWFAMELVEGGSLALRLRQSGRLSEREALRLFIPLVEALGHLWEHGVVHRDIKPANILIDRRGAKLADLGLAVAGDDPLLTNPGGTLGTPHYVSPEQARDPTQVDVRTDLWSLGASLYHALCGRPPFGGESLAEVLSGVLHSPITDPQVLEPRLSKGLALVVRKCLVRDLEKRYQTPQELLEDLERVRERRSPQINRLALDPVGGRWSQARRLGFLVAGLVAAVALWFAAARPDNPGEAGVDPALVQREETARSALDELGALLEGPSPLLSQGLDELEALESVVPESVRPRWLSVRAQGEAVLRNELREVRADLIAAATPLVATRRYEEARKLYALDLDGELESRLGFRVESLPEELGDYMRTWRDERLEEIQRREEGLLRAVRTALEGEAERALFAEVDRLQAEGRWNSARALCAFDPEALAARAGVSLAGLRDRSLADALGGLRARLVVRRQALDDAWSRELAGWIGALDAEEERVRAELSADPGGFAESPGERLRRAAEGLLTDAGLMVDEVPGGPDGTLWRALDERAERLDALAMELSDREGERLRSETEERFRLFDETVCRPLFAVRDYASVGTLWREFRSELAGGGEGGWRAALRERVDLRLDESELLQGLMQRAVAGLRRRDGLSAEVSFGAIAVSGELVVPADPLQQGFQLRVAGRTRELDLQSLATDDLARFADLPVGEARSEDPDELLLLSLFLFREGRLEDAQRTLLQMESLPAGRAALLVGDLRERVARELEAERAAVDERQGTAEALLAELERQRGGHAEAQLILIDELLEGYADLGQVRERAEELRDRRDRLRADPRPVTPADLREAFAPVAVERLGGQGVALEFDFGDPAPGAWEQGSWRPDGLGWVAASRDRDWSSFAADPGLRLALRQGATVLEDIELAVELELEADARGPAKLLVVSVAGFQVGLVGAGLPGDEGGARWLVTAGDLEENLEQLREGKGQARSLLQRGRGHLLRIETDRRQGRVRLLLDGELLGSRRLPAPRTVPRALVVRSWEPVRLVGVRLEARLP